MNALVVKSCISKVFQCAGDLIFVVQYMKIFPYKDKKVLFRIQI